MNKEDLTVDELRRYDRHIILPEVGLHGQSKLKNSSALLIGAGGLGSPLALYLAAAGVGRLGLVDFDVVDETNLQRQIIHGTSTIGESKLVSAKKRLLDLNPNVQVETHEVMLHSENALELFAKYDVVADGTDNFPTRYLVNDACVLTGTPNVYGSIFRFEGQISVFHYQDGPCYRCLYSEPPPPGLVPSCAEGGVFGVLPGTVGCIQATEVIKVLLGVGKTLTGRLLIFDALHQKFRELKLRRNPNCAVCGENPTVTELIDYQEFCGVPKQENAKALDAKQPVPVIDADEWRVALNSEIHEITVQQFESLRKADPSQKKYKVLDVRQPYEARIVSFPNSVLIPLDQLENRHKELDASDNWIVYCKGGVRGQQAVDFLKSKGFPQVKNISGGIIEYAKKIDSSLHTY